MFHVSCGDEPDGILRGICFVKDARAYLSLFSDASIETLFLAVEAEATVQNQSIPPNQGLTTLWQESNLDSLRLLTALYINSQPYKTAESIQRLVNKKPL